MCIAFGAGRKKIMLVLGSYGVMGETKETGASGAVGASPDDTTAPQSLYVWLSTLHCNF